MQRDSRWLASEHGRSGSLQLKGAIFKGRGLPVSLQTAKFFRRRMLAYFELQGCTLYMLIYLPNKVNLSFH